MRIGNRSIIFTTTLIIPTNQDAWVQFDVDEWHVKLKIVFRKEAVDEGKPPKGANLTLEAVDDYGILTFLNWNNALGTTLKAPFEVATASNGLKLYLMVWHVLTGETNRLDLQFLLGEPS